jgi:hypothetical protein
MKKLIFLSLLFPLFAMGQKQVDYTGILKVQVNGDTVTLREDSAWRDCGAVYKMNVIAHGDTLYWYEINTGDAYACLCCYNLSVTIDSLKTGHYTAKVYYSELAPFYDTVYSGSIQFEITEQNLYQAFSKINEYQSDCFTYTSINDNNEAVNSLSVFPNPVHNLLHFKSHYKNKKTIEIYDMQHRCLYRNETDRESLDINLSNFESGIYIFSCTNNFRNFYTKIIKSE